MAGRASGRPGWRRRSLAKCMSCRGRAQSRVARWIVLLGIGLGVSIYISRAADPKPGEPASGPRSPREELATFRVLAGFRVELAACEPDVIDPVAMTFDERGRIFVAEMRGYPNGGRGVGDISSGRVRCLTDKDNDGTF